MRRHFDRRSHSPARRDSGDRPQRLRHQNSGRDSRFTRSLRPTPLVFDRERFKRSGRERRRRVADGREHVFEARDEVVPEMLVRDAFRVEPFVSLARFEAKDDVDVSTGHRRRHHRERSGLLWLEVAARFVGCIFHRDRPSVIARSGRRRWPGRGQRRRVSGHSCSRRRSRRHRTRTEAASLELGVDAPRHGAANGQSEESTLDGSLVSDGGFGDFGE